MAALRRRDSEVAESRFDNDARAADFVPLHRNAQPRFGRSPAAHANQQVRPVLFIKLAIETRDRLGDFLAAAALKTLRIDDHYIVKIVDASVAQNLVALADQLLGLHLVQR